MALFWKRLLPVLAGSALLAAGPASALDPARKVAQYKHSRWNSDEGAPPNVRALAQTPDGYLWLGTDTGLYRFDGVTFEPMSDPAGSGSREVSVSALMTSKAGDLWAGHIDGRITRTRGGRTLDVSAKPLRAPVWRFIEDHDGAVWASTGDFTYPLIRYQSGRWKAISTGPGNKSPRTLAVDRHGTLWIVLESEVLFRRRNGTRFERTGEVFPLSPDIAIDARGRIWASGSEAGTRQIPNYALGDKTRPDTPTHKSDEKPGGRRILFDRHGSLWGTAGSRGVFRIRSPDAASIGTRPNPGEEIYTSKEGLSSDNASPILEDREGNIWVGTTAGLDRFRAANVVFETGIMPRSRWGYVLFSDSRGIVHAVDSDTAYRVRPGGEPEVVLRNLDNPQTLCEARDGAIWLSSNDGLFRSTGGEFAKVPGPPGRFNYTDCAQDKGGNLWFSLVGSGFLKLDQKGWTHFDAGQTKINPMVFLPERQGGLLAYVRADGLKRVDFPRINTVWADKDMPGGYVRVLYQGARHVLIGSASGLARLNGSRIDVLQRSYPWLRGVTGLIETPKGETWVLATGGIARLSTKALDRAFGSAREVLRPEIFNRMDGLPPTAPFYSKNSAVRGGDGRLWFITSEGIVWIDPARLARNSLAPPVKITALVANGRRYPDPAAISLAKGISRLEIGYSGLSLSIPERVRFRYKLDGVDENWVDPGTRRQAFYTNLAPGDYRFQVIAANNDGVWNRSGATLEFSIAPTFVQSRTFLLLCLLAAGLLLWGLYAMRVRQLAVRMKSRLDERLRERERIARELHDTLLQGVQGLILQFQSVADEFPREKRTHEELAKALDRADEIVAEGRDRVRALRSTEHSGALSDTIADGADRLLARSKLDIAIATEGTPRDLRPLVADEIIRVADEALFNIDRHAQATSVEIHILYARSGLTIRIADNGVGIPEDILAAGGREGHFGLLGMRERAHRIGAELAVRNLPGKGAEVALTIPARVAFTDFAGRRWPAFFARPTPAPAR
jgi:signal transduction histidine kinase/ligand-binding sensor domain-containing protein